MTGKERTNLLNKAMAGWLLRQGYSVYLEVGVTAWGKRRCDVVALNTSTDIKMVEVKQSWPDFKNDAKWVDYLPHCNTFYFGLPQDLWDKHEADIRKKIKGQSGIGVVVLEDKGYAKVKVRPKSKVMNPLDKKALIVRLAWRGGISRANSRRTKQIIKALKT